MPYARVNDIDLHYETYGPHSQEPLVLLHGFSGFESPTRPDAIDAAWKKSLIEMHGDPDWRWLLKNYGLMAVSRVRSGGGEITRHRLGEIACPTLIVQGQRDRMNPPELAEIVHQGIRSSKLVMFPCGHIVQEAEAEAFNQLVLGFLDGLSQKREERPYSRM